MQVDIGVILVAVVAAIPGVLSFIVHLRKSYTEEVVSKADITETLNQTALSLIQPLRDRIAELLNLLDEHREEYESVVTLNTALRGEMEMVLAQRDSAIICLRRLSHQLESLGAVPVVGIGNDGSIVIPRVSGKDVGKGN